MMPLPLRRLLWWFAVGNLLVSIFMLPLSLGQHISASNRRRQYDFASDRPEIFYDTRTMTDGREETVYLLKGETESYYFLLEEGGTPLSIVVTPCASNITFVLTNKAMASSSEEDDPEDPFSSQMEGQSSVRVEEFKGGGNMVYTTRDARKGIYILSLQAIKTDTTVKLFATTRPESVSLFPELPVDARIRVTATSRRSIKFSWNPSGNPSELLQPSLEYCVSVNKVMNFQSHCSVLAHLQGDTRPTPPPNSGFGFPWEKSKNRERQRKAKPIKAMSPKRLFYACVGSKTNFTFDKAKPETTYFIDIHVVDKNTNRSSTYVGAVVQTKKRKRRQALLKNEKRKTVSLQKGVRSVSVKLVLTKQVEKGVLELKSCRGVLPFEILYDNKLIHKSAVRRIKIVRMKNLPAGAYILRFKGKRKRKRSVMVFFTESGRYRPPRLPVDYRIKVFNTLTTCTNVTLAWMGSNVKQKYCLYKKELVDNQKVRKHRCSDPGHRSDREKVFCTRFRHRQPSKAVISKTVTGLKPGTNYLFDVYISRGNSASLVYLNQQVRTKTQC
ncbi:protein NDNF-like [Haliotis rufescens]|uniref:protein NDNF-like n=1 Tax=Haliotis rufescens TaxID=6454 RepID=UPI00201EFDA5|nr:protein NDNF-like [Haliotis rufescens]